MARYVICTVCHKKFDLEKEQGVRVSTKRYAHLSCKPTDYLELIPLKNPPDEDLTKLKDYIQTLIGDKANWASIMKQITKFKEENGYTYSGMLKTLTYFYGVKGNPIPKNYNITGIIPYTYKQAYDYYYELFVISQQAEKVDLPQIISKVKEIEIPVPVFEKRKKLFNLEELEEEVDKNEQGV